MSDSSTAAAQEPVTFTIDGKSFTLDEPKQTAGALLLLDGLDPANYYLAEIRPGGAEPKRLRPDEVVHIKDGEEFVSVRISAPVE